MELLWQLASNKSGGCGSDMVWWRVDTFIRRVDTFSFPDVVGCRWVSLTQKTIYGLHSFDVHEGESHGMQNTTHGVVERGRVARVRGWSQKSYWNFWEIFAKMSPDADRPITIKSLPFARSKLQVKENKLEYSTGRSILQCFYLRKLTF